MAEPAVVDPKNVQGLVYGGWGQAMPYAAFVFATFGDGAPAWLTEVLPLVTSADLSKMPRDTRVQIALAPDGFRALGVDDDGINGLAQEATMGMASRWRVLGDRGASAPEAWTLLPPGTRCDVLLLLFAHDEAPRTTLVANERARIEKHGGQVVAVELSAKWRDKEPFGFADGLSQPSVIGLGERKARVENQVATGEILLGYQNQYGRVPQSPTWKGLDLGIDGSYLVFRKLEQDVLGFWQYFAAQAKKLAGQQPVPADADDATTWLAARALGRWPSGTSLVRSPDRDDESQRGDNDFEYLPTDAEATACPVASHVRRANPRDARGGTATESYTVSNRHRMLRRGRAYGDFVEPEAAQRGEGAGVARGLCFISLQASIARGFEFIQQTWNVNGHFHGLFDEPDPVVGPGGGSLSIACPPLRLRLNGVPRFVTTRGGGYFFLPSIAALRALAG